MLKIEKGVPLTRKIRARNSGEFNDFIIFCKNAKVGESVVVAKTASNYRIALSIARIWLNRVFTTSGTKNGLRIWRIK